MFPCVLHSASCLFYLTFPIVGLFSAIGTLKLSNSSAIPGLKMGAGWSSLRAGGSKMRAVMRRRLKNARRGARPHQEKPRFARSKPLRRAQKQAFPFGRFKKLYVPATAGVFTKDLHFI